MVERRPDVAARTPVTGGGPAEADEEDGGGRGPGRSTGGEGGKAARDTKAARWRIGWHKEEAAPRRLLGTRWCLAARARRGGGGRPEGRDREFGRTRSGGGGVTRAPERAAESWSMERRWSSGRGPIGALRRSALAARDGGGRGADLRLGALAVATRWARGAGSRRSSRRARPPRAAPRRNSMRRPPTFGEQRALARRPGEAPRLVCPSAGSALRRREAASRAATVRAQGGDGGRQGLDVGGADPIREDVTPSDRRCGRRRFARVSGGDRVGQCRWPCSAVTGPTAGRARRANDRSAAMGWSGRDARDGRRRP